MAIESVDALPEVELRSGTQVGVRARVRLGALTCDEVSVELYLGVVSTLTQRSAISTASSSVA